MTERAVLATAKKPGDLAGAYAEAKSDAKAYGFSAVTALKEDVVSHSMTEKKQPAQFVVEVDISGKVLLVQMFCEVKGGVRSVLGRKEIKSVDDAEHAIKLLKMQSYEKFKKQLHQ